MSKAFRCDRCNEFQEGRPQRFKVREYLSAGFTGWTDGKNHHKWELCDECKENLIETLGEWNND